MQFPALLTKIALSEKTDIILPLHPRTSKILSRNLDHQLFGQISNNPYIKIIPPTSFFDTLVLEKHCRLVLTDSGGVQKEAFFQKKPVLILRAETEWVEIVENGTGIITDADRDKIISGFHYFSENRRIGISDDFR
ncbi:MAG: UDP-N-acetyl glucosamine 2-epimerase [Marinilabiliales bacterium]|nr:UDP-N-acetyl glucosamine 2-epimerase [Marinilabiliales bacterium]